MLTLFCGIFALETIPFWILASVFVSLFGGWLLVTSGRLNPSNILILLVLALCMGPGCFYLFTKVLTIDLP